MTRTRNGRLLTRAASVVLLTLAVTQLAQAATRTVTNTDDGGPGSLRQTIADAVTGDTIDFALGCSPCTITLTTEELLIDKNLTISGPGAEHLTVSGNSATRVFRIAPGVVAEIGGLRVTRGISHEFGGGVFVDRASLTLRSTVFLGNSAGAGGAVFYNGALTAIGSTFTNNHANLGGGGAILGFGTLTVSDTDFVRNIAGFGGAISLNALPPSSTARIMRGTFSGNGAGTGGAVAIGPAVRATFIASTVTDNKAGDGGGIFNDGALTIIDCAITNNSADGALAHGGGVYSHTGSNVLVVNSTLSGNSARLGGGGLWAELAAADITNSTIVLNQHGGVAGQFAGTSTLSNTIAAGNTDGDVSGAIDATKNNLVGGDVSLILDPILADNGGPTLTHALVANSPAIGAGSNGWLPVDQFDLDGDGDTSERIPVDQRGQGFPRVQGHNVDIGAVEATCPAITVTPATLPNGTVGTAYSQSLGAAGGQGPHTFSAVNLPAGVTLSSAGVLSGTPTTAGTFTIAVTVTEDSGCARTIELTLTVVEDTTCGITVGPATLQTPYIATLYYQPLSTSPSGQYAYSVSWGALPPGLHIFSVGNNGFIGGFPTTPGTYTFTIKTKKKNSPCESTRTYTVTVPTTVAPQLTCVVKTGNKQYTARFGYDNTTGAAVTIPVGSDNYFTPGNQNRGQTTVFQPGKVTNAFGVTFTVSGNNSNLAIWFLRGPDGQRRPVNITTATFGCQ